MRLPLIDLLDLRPRIDLFDRDALDRDVWWTDWVSIDFDFAFYSSGVTGAAPVDSGDNSNPPPASFPTDTPHHEAPSASRLPPRGDERRLASAASGSEGQERTDAPAPRGAGLVRSVPSHLYQLPEGGVRW